MSVIDDLVELLDRQYQFLLRTRGADFLRQLPVFFETVSVDPRIATHLGDQRRDVVQAGASLRRLDEDLVQKLVAVRRDLVARIPATDDSTMQDPGGPSLDYEFSLAWFDRVVAGAGPHRGIPVQPTGKEDPTRAGALLAILRSKLQEVRLPRDESATPTAAARFDVEILEDIERALGNIGSVHEHAHRAFLLAKETLPGASLVALERFITKINPQPTRIENDEDWRRLMDGTFRDAIEGIQPLVHRTLFAAYQQKEDAPKIERLEDQLKVKLERVYEDLRRRIATVRSALALVHRFKNRCEWHDRARLRALATSSSTPEQDLADEMARWLFDQGLSPLTRPRTSGLEPDLLDPTARPTVYVEAKQYSNGRGRSLAIAGFRQLCDTVGRLRGSKYEVREAFMAVFRLGGPRLLMPEQLDAEGCRVHPILIDIASSAASGSRQRHKPLEISASDLLDTRPTDVKQPALPRERRGPSETGRRATTRGRSRSRSGRTRPDSFRATRTGSAR